MMDFVRRINVHTDCHIPHGQDPPYMSQEISGKFKNATKSEGKSFPYNGLKRGTVILGNFCEDNQKVISSSLTRAKEVCYAGVKFVFIVGK